MEYFINQIRLIMPVLGFEFLREKPHISSQIKSPTHQTLQVFETAFPTFEIFSKKHNISATAKEVDGDFIVLAGSESQKGWIGSEGHSYHSLFQTLFREEKIVFDEKRNSGVFKEDVAFSSPSAAAAIIFGRASNGRTAWKLQGTAKTYEDWQNEILNSTNTMIDA